MRLRITFKLWKKYKDKCMNVKKEAKNQEKSFESNTVNKNQFHANRCISSETNNKTRKIFPNFGIIKFNKYKP